MFFCYICGNSSRVVHTEPNVSLDCELCGSYTLLPEAQRETLELAPSPIPDAHLYSGAIREIYDRTGEPVTILTLRSLLESVFVPRTPVQQVDKLILYLMARTKDLMDGVWIGDRSFQIIYGRSQSDLSFAIRAAKSEDLLKEGTVSSHIALTYKGWQKAEEISKTRPDSTRAFVAMRFAEDLDTAWSDGILPALEHCGYQAVRVDKKEHNGKIDDFIIAEIRKSSIVIADFTKHRGNVYFEAGFAMGLGTPVIFTCRSNDMNKAQFDTRQYNHITWATPSELKEKLINRIEATIRLG